MGAYESVITIKYNSIKNVHFQLVDLLIKAYHSCIGVVFFF